MSFPKNHRMSEIFCRQVVAQSRAQDLSGNLAKHVADYGMNHQQPQQISKRVLPFTVNHCGCIIHNNFFRNSESSKGFTLNQEYTRLA